MGCGSSTAGNGTGAADAASKNVKELTYSDIKVISDGIVSGKDTTHVLVDCRTTDEVAEAVTIPGSIVVPLDEMEEALKMTPEEFEAKYHAKKFTIDNKIIVFCLRGMRSEKALPLLKEAGYNNSEQYSGSWMEWSQEALKAAAARKKPVS